MIMNHLLKKSLPWEQLEETTAEPQSSHRPGRAGMLCNGRSLGSKHPGSKL